MGPEALVQMAGFVASHALTAIEDEGRLVPFLMAEDAAAKRQMQRLEMPAVEAQQRVAPMLDQGIDGMARAVLAVGGDFTKDEQSRTLLTIEGADWGMPVEMTVRFEVAPAGDRGKLAVQRIAFDDIDPGTDEHGWVLAQFTDGMARHPKVGPWADEVRRLN